MLIKLHVNLLPPLARRCLEVGVPYGTPEALASRLEGAG